MPCCCSGAQSYMTICNPMNCSTSGFPVLHHLLEFAQTHVSWISDAIQPSHPLSPPSPPSLSLSQHQGLFQWVSSLHQVTKVLEPCFSISPSNKYSGLISLRIEWFDLLAVQRSLKSLLQHHKSKVLFMVQLSHPYMTTGKIIALTIWNFVDKLMSLLLNTLSRYVIAFFLPRSKHLLTLYDFSFALRWSSREETPQVQGKRNPSKMIGVARGHQRADTLKP